MASTTNPAGNRPDRPKLGRGKSSKGAPGTWKRNAAGKQIFVADKPRGTSSAAPVLSVKHFTTAWSPSHQAQALKFFGGDGLTVADFRALNPAQQRDIMKRVQSGYRTSRQPNSAMAPQSMVDIYKAAEQAAGLKYGSAQRQVAVDQKTSDIQQGRIGNYFADYQAILNDASAKTKAAYDQAQGAVTATNAGTEATAATQQGQVQQAAADDAAARGAKIDPNLAATAAQASASRAASGNAMTGTIATQGAGAVAYDQRLRGAAANQMIQAHEQERTTRKALDNKLRELLTEKGEFENTTRQDLIGAERKNALEKAAFELDVTQEQNDQTQASATATDRRNSHYGPGSPVQNSFGFTYDEWTNLSKKRQQQERDKKHGKRTTTDDPDKYYGLTKQEWDALDMKGKLDQKKRWAAAGRANSKDDPDSPFASEAAQSKRVSQIETLRTIISQPQKWPAGSRTPGKRMTRAEVINSLMNGGILVKGKRIDPRLVNVAGNLVANNGKLGPYGQKVARQLGLEIDKAGWGTVNGPSAVRTAGGGGGTARPTMG